MTTSEMYNLAQNNTKTYQCELGTYNSEDGFVFEEGVADDLTMDEFADLLFVTNDWSVKVDPAKDMTLEDIEKALGYKINLVHKQTKDAKGNDKRDAHYEFINSILDALDSNWR